MYVICIQMNWQRCDFFQIPLGPECSINAVFSGGNWDSSLYLNTQNVLFVIYNFNFFFDDFSWKKKRIMCVMYRHRFIASTRKEMKEKNH